MQSSTALTAAWDCDAKPILVVVAVHEIFGLMCAMTFLFKNCFVLGGGLAAVEALML